MELKGFNKKIKKIKKVVINGLFLDFIKETFIDPAYQIKY